jgi:hypothetical protein
MKLYGWPFNPLWESNVPEWSSWIAPVVCLASGVALICLLCWIHGRPYQRAAGDLLEWLLCALSRRACGVYQGFRSYRIAYQAEVNQDKVIPIK